MSENEIPSFLNFAVEEAVEAELLAEGEYLMEIVSARVGTSKKEGSGQYLAVTMRPLGTGYTNPNLVNHILMLPDSKQEPSTNNNRLLGLKRFYEAFSVPRDNDGKVALEDLKSLQGKAIVVVQNNGEYGDQNSVRRFL
jgi:hypothetical protein